MEENTIILNGNNFIGEKININLNELNKKKSAEYIIIKNCEITKELTNKILNLKKIKNIWLVNCNIIESINIPNIEILRIEKCENIENILYSNSLTQLYVNNCNRFDIKNIKDIKLKILGLEYLEINNFYLLEEMKTLEKLELKEIDLRNINFVNLKHLKKIVLNGSIVNNKEETIKYLKNSGVEVEFLEKNLPIG